MRIYAMHLFILFFFLKTIIFSDLTKYVNVINNHECVGPSTSACFPEGKFIFVRIIFEGK